MRIARGRTAAATMAAVLLAGCAGTGGEASLGRASPRASPAPSSSAPSPSPSPSGPGCSAAAAAPLEAQQLPPPVASTRAAIAAAAAGCDYAGLERLAQSGSRPFTYSFGADGDPAGFWREQEQRGERPLWTLVEVLRRQHVERTQEGQHVWPAAFGYDDWESVPQPARDELRGLHGPQDLAGFEQFGAYVGFRVGITPDGEWLFFVAGD